MTVTGERTYQVFVDAETALGMESVFVGLVREDSVRVLRESLTGGKSIWIENTTGELTYIPHARIYRVRFKPED